MRLRTGKSDRQLWRTQTVLDGLSLALPAGKITALLGPNRLREIDAVELFFSPVNTRLWRDIAR